MDGLKRASILTYGENVEIPRPILPKSCKKSEDLAIILKNENEKVQIRKNKNLDI